MAHKYTHLVNGVIKNLDWDSILLVHKSFNKGVGCEATIIPGVKRKPYSEELTIKDIKQELRAVLNFVIERGSGELNYGLWLINWYNADEEEFMDLGDDDFEDDENDQEEHDEFNDVETWFPTKLQVILSPQRISIMDYSSERFEVDMNPNFKSLDIMLEEAIGNEDYELANKLKAVISHKSKDKNHDAHEDK